MTDLNSVHLIGRLTRDIGNDEKSFGYVGNGSARANFSIAVNRSKKNGDQWIDEVYYFDITLWGKQAENLKPYLLKGKMICVEGHLKQDRWEDSEGKKQSKISIVADNVQLLSKKEGSSENNTSGAYSQSLNAAQGNQQTNDEGFPEDVPF